MIRSQEWDTLQSAGDGIIVTDLAERIEFANTAAERILGVQQSDLAGRPALEALRLQERYAGAISGKLAELAVMSDSPVNLGTDLFIIHSDGSARDIEGEITARRSSGVATGTVITFRDVTARRWEEFQRREEYRLRAIAQLAGAVGHELNNLLTRVIGHAEHVEHLCPGNAAVAEQVAGVLSASDAIAAVTRRLVTLSGRRVLRPAATSINELLERIRPRLEAQLPRGIELFINLDETAGGAVLVDQDQMSEALIDLARVSSDRMHGKGTITFATEGLTMDEHSRARHARRYVRLTMTDTGPRLDRVATEELFEPSWIAEEGRPSGIGLFAVRNAISVGSGHLLIESRGQTGATFVVLLPQVDAPETDPGQDEAEAGAGRARNLLLVEDDHAIRILLRNTFEQRGYRVIEARDGEEALMQAALQDAPIDMVITDVVMPNMDGPTLVRRLTGTHPETSFLLTSGCPLEAADVQELIQAGADYIEKPFSQRDLLARVETILAEKSQEA